MPVASVETILFATEDQAQRNREREWVAIGQSVGGPSPPHILAIIPVEPGSSIRDLFEKGILLLELSGVIPFW